MTITRDSSQSVLTLDTSSLAEGTHELVIESYDANSSVKSALKTDKILIIVPQTENNEPETESNKPETETNEPEILPEIEQEVGTELSFKNYLQKQVIRLGKPLSWTLPEIIEGSYPLKTIDFDVDYRIAPNLSLDQASRTFTFSDKKV